MLPADDVTTLALFYHLNSEPWLDENAADDAPYEVDYKEMLENGSLPLPAPDPALAVVRLARLRESCRRFAGEPMPLSTLASLLGGAYGLAGLRRVPGALGFSVRTVPSAGALFPLELYCVTSNVGGRPDGLHHYKIRDHALETLRSGPLLTELASCLVGQAYIAGANAIVIFSAVFERTLKKYGARGYRYILLEAGHAAQNLCLIATEQNLGSLCMGGFFDGPMSRLLGSDGRREAPLYAVAVGVTDTADDAKTPRSSC